MIAKIIPILRLPANLGVFDYLIPEELSNKIKTGQLVKTNFRSQKINGLVTEIKAKSTIEKNKLKPVLQIIDELPFLTINQLKLINWLADYYYISPALAAKLIISFLPKTEKKEIVEKEKKIKLKMDFSAEEKKIFKTLTKSKKNQHLVWCNQEEIKLNLYLELIKNLKGGEVLILFPDIDSLENAANYLKKYTANYLVVSSNLKEKELAAAWQKIKDGEARVILGTRLAVFYPYQNLKYLIIDEENNHHYKQWDMNPRYDAKIIAQKIAKKFQAKLIFFSVLPTVDSFWQAEKNKIKLHKILKIATKTEIINLAEEMKKGDFSIISRALEEKIKQNLAEKKQSALILNRKGYARITVCRDCGFIAECPNCGTALNLSHNRLKCPNCRFEQDNLLFCPRCHNPEIKSLGSGTQKIESEIRKIFPQIKIARLDSDNQKNASAIKKLFQEKKIEILIGTQMILKPWLKKNLGLIAFTNIDTDLNQPGYRSTENALQLIAYALNLLKENGCLLIQTFRADNPILKNLTEADWLNFYKKEIKERQNLHYPPFGTLIKLIYQNKNKKKVELIPEKIEKKIKTAYPEEQIFSTKIKKIRNNYQKAILIKSKRTDFRFKKSDVPNDWLIDLTPYNLD